MCPMIGGKMSKIEIINRALLKLGEPPVSSLNDAAFGKSYDMIYEDIKKLLLSAYPWRFATVIKQLPKLQEKFGKRFMYRLPHDCLLLLKVINADAHIALNGYEIAGHSIVLEEETLVAAEYVKNQDDDNLFSPLFKEALAAKIAAELAMRLKHSANFKQVFENEFYNLIVQAELNNEIAKCVENLPDNSWVSVKQSYSF